jgi:hypothetical protein
MALTQQEHGQELRVEAATPVDEVTPATKSINIFSTKSKAAGFGFFVGGVAGIGAGTLFAGLAPEAFSSAMSVFAAISITNPAVAIAISAAIIAALFAATFAMIAKFKENKVAQPTVQSDASASATI